MSDGRGPLEVTAELARFASALDRDAVPAQVLERTALLLADCTACALGGADAASTDAIARGLAEAGSNVGTFAVPGRGAGCSAYGAAFLAAAAAHALDFDDTHAPAELHPGAPVIAAALAAAQLEDADTDALLVGIVAGYEVMTRVAFGLPATPHAARGFHLTATVGVFGATAAAGSILGLSPTELEHAFGTALSRAAGSGQFIETGAWTKRYHVGAAAADGLQAAVLARSGLTGAARAFEGRWGFFRLHSDAPRPELAVAGLGTTWELLRTGVKPYACCRAIHAPLDAVQSLSAAGRVRPERIVRIRVGLAARCADVVAFPQERKRTPANAVECQFSVHYCLAVTVLHGAVDPASFDALRTDQAVLDLMSRIDVELDDEAEAAYPTSFAARVRLDFDDGTTAVEYVPVPLGEPERMLGADRLRAKFEALAGSCLDADAVDRLLTAVLSTPTSPIPVARLVELATPRPVAVS